MQSTIGQYIDIRENRRGQERAFVAATRIRIQDLALDHERNGLSAEEIAIQYANLTLAQVYSALAFYFDNKVRVWSWIREDEQYAMSLRGELTAHNVAKQS